MVKSTDFGVRKTWALNVTMPHSSRTYSSYLNSLNLNFLICEMETNAPLFRGTGGKPTPSLAVRTAQASPRVLNAAPRLV